MAVAVNKDFSQAAGAGVVGSYRTRQTAWGYSSWIRFSLGRTLAGACLFLCLSLRLHPAG